MKLVLQLLLLTVVLAPLALVLTGAVLARRERRALVAAVRAQLCPSCSGVLTEQSVRLAEESWGKYAAALRKKYPQTRFHLVRPMDATCERCGAQLKLDSTSETLRAVAVDLSVES